MILWKFTFREIKNRPGRATLTLLSIVIGVAAVVAVNLGIDGARRASQEMYERITGKAALEISAEGGVDFNQSVVADVQRLPGVESVVPVLQHFTTLRHDAQKIQLLVMGIDPANDGAIRDYQIQEPAGATSLGSLFAPGKKQALMEAGLAAGMNIKLGDEIKIMTYAAAAPKKLTVVGLLAPQGVAGFNQGGIIFLPLPVVQEYFAYNKKVINSASLVLQPGADQEKVRAAVKECLPAYLTVHEPISKTQVAKDRVKSIEQGLLFCRALMIALAVITIFNTFLMNVGERRRQLSILRAIGTTRSQIMRMLVLEGIAMGIVGTVLGSLLGTAGAQVVNGAMSRVFSDAAPPLHLSVRPFIAAAIIGPIMSLIAMVVPAWLAGRVSPLEGMRPAVFEPGKSLARWFVIMSLSAFTVGFIVMSGCIFKFIPIVVATPAGVMFTVSFVLLIALVLGPLVWLAGSIFYPVFGTEGRLAARQILRRRTRSTLTIGVVYVSVSSGIGMGTAILNNVADARAWQKQTFQGDFLVRATRPDPATGQSPPMPESLGNEFRQTPGVTAVDTLSTVPAVTVGDQHVQLLACSFSNPDELPLYLNQGDPREIHRKMDAGQAVVGSALAYRLKKEVGDQFTLTTPQGEQAVTIAATMTDYSTGGLLVCMDRSTVKRLFGLEGVQAFSIKIAESARATVEPKIKTICAEQGIMLQSFADARAKVEQAIHGQIVSMWTLLAMGLVVAAFSIANTLTINVLEQTRELALLRVVAMTRRQVRKTILAQAGVLGLIGLTTGCGGGVVGAYVTNLCSVILLEHPVLFALDPMLIGGSFVVSMIIVMVAAWFPAARAARLNLLIALQYE